MTVTGSSFTAKPAGNLPDGATCSLTVNLAGSLGGATAKTVGFKTMAGTLTYTNVIYGMASDNGDRPMKIEGATCAALKVTAAANATRFQTGFFPLANSWMLNAPQARGRILVAAQAPSDANKRNVVILDPVANVLRDYNNEEGVPPSIDEQAPDPQWVNVSLSNNSDPAIGNYADLPTMLVYVTRVAGNVLLCKEKATGAVTEVTRTAGGWKAFVAYHKN